MTGALMQLIAYGAQDIYLTGNPIITYFKTVYRRHTNFAMESILQSFDGVVGFGKKVSSVITRNGDLIMGAYIQATLPDLLEKAHSGAPQYRYTRWVDNVGHYLIKEVSIEIGGRVIDTHFSDWLEIWSQLTVPASMMPGYLKMIGQDPLNALGQATGLQRDVFSNSQNDLVSSVHTAPYKASSTTLKGRDIYIPLQFWFCRNVGLALPLVALQHHEVKLNVEFRPVHQLVMLNIGDHTEKGLPKLTNWANTSSLHTTNIQQSAELDAALWIDYVFLDTDERRRFAQVSHEYLIEQVQCLPEHYVNTTTTVGSVSNLTIDLFFNHPVKELVWVAKPYESTKEWNNFTDTQMPLLPPFANIGYNATSDANVIGLSGLPLGYMDTETLVSNIAVNASTAALEMVFESGSSGGVTLTVAGTASLSTGDILLYYNEDKDLSIHIIYTSTGTVQIPAITYPVGLSGNLTFTFESIFRPPATLTYDSSYVATTAASNSSFAAVTTWDHLNRLTNYNMVRPVNRNGMAKNPFATGVIHLNGHERMQRRPGEYFNWVQCDKHHCNIPRSPGINVYSFAVHPEDHQPSGTCNFSRLDSAQLTVQFRPLYYGVTGTGTSTDGTIQTESRSVPIKVFAVNYNILRIMNGMGGVAYSS